MKLTILSPAAREELNKEISLYHTPDSHWDTRCRICGWPLYEEVFQGCVRRETSEYCTFIAPMPQRRADAPGNWFDISRWPILLILMKVSLCCVEYMPGQFVWCVGLRADEHFDSPADAICAYFPEWQAKQKGIPV